MSRYDQFMDVDFFYQALLLLGFSTEDVHKVTTLAWEALKG